MMVDEIRRTAGHLNRGNVILYPTDTIWGLGCDATNREAVEKIYKIKQRSGDLSMLVLMTGTGMLARHIREIPAKALEIIEAADKPTTIIYPDAFNLAPNLVATDGSVGVRLTSDPFCLELMEHTGFPIVSTSANISGNLPPDSFREIDPMILDRVDYVVNWRQDDTTPAEASSIVRVDKHGETTLLRP